MLPYVSLLKLRRKNPCPNRIDTCQQAFNFQNVLPLTKDAKEFEREVSKQKISGNLDSPEAGLDAIMQAAVCKVRAYLPWMNGIACKDFIHKLPFLCAVYQKVYMKKVFIFCFLTRRRLDGMMWHGFWFTHLMILSTWQEMDD